jgi:hypothetical protein
MSTKSTRNAPRPTPRPASKSASRKPSKTAATPRKPPARAPAPTGTKQSQLIALLRSPSGGTMEQISKLTGWQQHSVRGTISGTLRKRLKLNVACAGGTYRIVGTQP